WAFGRSDAGSGRPADAAGAAASPQLPSLFRGPVRLPDRELDADRRPGVAGPQPDALPVPPRRDQCAAVVPGAAAVPPRRGCGGPGAEAVPDPDHADVAAPTRAVPRGLGDGGRRPLLARGGAGGAP